MFQALVTFVQGVPHVGQEPLLRWTPARVIAAHYVVLGVAVIASVYQVHLIAYGDSAFRLLLIPSWVISGMILSGRLRAGHNHVLHHASHGDFGFRSWLVGEIAGLVSGTMSFGEYVRTHARHHKDTGSDGDPDRELVESLGFWPGCSREYYWRLLARVLVSPHYFLRHALGRLRSNLNSETRLCRRIAFVALHGIPLAINVALALIERDFRPAIVYLCGWAIWFWYGYFVSAVLYALGLHAWYQTCPLGTSPREVYAMKTVARFLGDELPARELSGWESLTRWVRWWARFVVLHLLIGRLFVVVGNNQTHDAHHLDPSSKNFDWLHANYDRARLVRIGHNLRHVWGVLGAIDANFRMFANLPRRFGTSNESPSPDQSQSRPPRPIPSDV